MPALTQAQLHAPYLVTRRERYVEAVAQAPIARAPVVIAHIIVLIGELFTVVVNEQGVTCAGLEPRQHFVADVTTDAHAVGSAEIVARTELGFQTCTQLLGELVRSLNRSD